jgi:hypothetical protein
MGCEKKTCPVFLINSLCPFQENAKSDESRVLAKLLAEDKDEGPNGLVRSVCLFLFLC